MCACVFVVCLLCCVVLSSPISNTVTITFVETDTCVHKKKCNNGGMFFV